MSTELIINATLPETRIALLEDSEIQELHIERDSERGIVGNIYKGKVIRVLPGMQAAFVDIGLEKAAFLYVDDIFFPDMKIPLQTHPLPAPNEIVGVKPVERSAIEVGPRPVAPIDVTPRPPVVGRPVPATGRRGERGRGRQGRQPSKLTPPRPLLTPPIITAPASPEDHARLQREYARLMLNSADDAEEAPAATTLPTPLVTPVSTPASEAETAEANPVDMMLNQPAARAPQAEDLEEPVQTSDLHQIQETSVAEEIADDEGDEGSADTPVVYRAEPLIDAEAWVEDLADHEGEAEPAVVEVVPAAVEGSVVETTGLPVPLETAVEGVEPLVTPRKREMRGPLPEAPASDDSDDEDVAEMPRRRRHREQVNIADLVKEGQEILVQVAKDPIGTKGARLTCHVSLPGRYLVFMPTVDHIGVSRRIESEAERRRLKETISRIRPAKTGVIVRTASGKQTDKKLKADLDYLVATWNDIQKKFNKQRMPSPVYQDLTIVLRAIRDMFTDEVDKVVVDSKREHKAIMKFVTRFIPHVKDKIELYEGDIPIFDAYGIEQEITRSLERKVWLKSGGYLVVDQAEALVAIDVNTGRYVGKKTLEETILKTNLEAVKEIAYQLRLRNCGGIIILDLIDMEKEANKDKVYKALEEALKKDRSRPTIMKISQLGLIEMTRKRTRDSLVRSLCEPCTYCEGKGYVKNKLTIAYDIMRDLEREGAEKDTQGISIQCHPSVADVLLEDKRDVLADLEHQYSKKITIRGNGAYHVEQYELVAHRESKNLTWSSEERRTLIRQKAQERSQQLASEQRKKDTEERERKRKEQDEARQKLAAEREERRKLLETLRDQRKQQLEALREKRRLEAEERRAAAIASGQDPETLPVEEIQVSEDELEPLMGPDGKPVTLAELERKTGSVVEGVTPRRERAAPNADRDAERGRNSRRRRGRRGRGRGPTVAGGAAAAPTAGGRGPQAAGGRPPRAPRRSTGTLPVPVNSEAATAGGTVRTALPSPNEGASIAVQNADRESPTPQDLAGSAVGGAEEADGGPEGGLDAQGQRRRRRGRRGGRRHRFRRRPGTPGSPAGEAGAPGSGSEAPMNVSGGSSSDEGGKDGGFSDPQES